MVALQGACPVMVTAAQDPAQARAVMRCPTTTPRKIAFFPATQICLLGPYATTVLDGGLRSEQQTCGEGERARGLLQETIGDDEVGDPGHDSVTCRARPNSQMRY